jgi:hypothetical protein
MRPLSKKEINRILNNGRLLSSEYDVSAPVGQNAMKKVVGCPTGVLE